MLYVCLSCLMRDDSLSYQLIDIFCAGKHKPMSQGRYYENYMLPNHVYTLRVGGLAGLKISKSALLFLNHHNFSNTELIYTK